MPLSLSQGPEKWIRDFQKSTNPRFKNSSKTKRKEQAIAAYLSKKNKVSEEIDDIQNQLKSISNSNNQMTLEEIRLQYINGGINNLKSRIRDIKLIPTDTEVDNNGDEKLSEEERKSKLLDIAQSSTKLYRDKIKPIGPVENPNPDNLPHTKAQAEVSKATIRALTNQRNGGDVGKTCASNINGTSNEKSSDSNINFGLYPTSLTIEEYEKHIKSIFETIVAPTEETEEVIPEEVVTLTSGGIVEFVENVLLELEDNSWQYVDAAIRIIAEDNNVSVKEIYAEFKKIHKVAPDVWIRENARKQYCGMFPLDEVTRIYKTGKSYSVYLVFRGNTRRLLFFWPHMTEPNRTQMQASVEKFYPGGKLISYSPINGDINTNSMILIGPTNENYKMFQEDDWGFMSEESTAIYEEICAEEGEPISAPCQVEDGIYEMTIEDHDTGEKRVVRFPQEGELGMGKSFLKS